MITRPTVIITGAGASASYGFPLGQQLVEHIIATTAAETGPLRSELLLAGHADAAIDRFCNDLRNSDLYSIDAFLENIEPDLVDIGKAAIARILLDFENKCAVEHRLHGDNAPEDHWLRYVWNLLKVGTTAATFGSNKIAFITFNYERTIEEYFIMVLMFSFHVDRREAIEILGQLPIVHLHGNIAGVSFGAVQGDAVPLRDLAAGIRVVHDPLATGDSAFARAHEILASSMNVCLVGFGYHPTNIDRLRLKDFCGAQTSVYGSSFGMGDAEAEVARHRIGVKCDLRSGHPAEQYLREHVPLR